MTILLWLVAALGVVCIVLAILYLVARLRNSALAKDLTVTSNQNNNLIRENVRLCEDLEGTRATIKVRDIDIGRLVGEKEALRLEYEKWQGLYNELVNTLHDAQGDAHATVPLQEAVPVKRTRKKAGA